MLQKLVVQLLLKAFPQLTERDVRSTSMGAGGEDVQLSTKAVKLIPFKIECKNLKRISIYKYYDQAKAHKGKQEPLLVLKSNHKKPLAVVDLEYFIRMMK